MKKKDGKKKTTIPYFDYNLLFIIIFLICFGLVMLYSSSSYIAANNYGDDTFYLKRQIRAMLIGLLPLLIFAFTDYRKWKKFIPLCYILALILCLVVAVPGIGRVSNGSARWIQIGPINFQPSEFAKLAIIMFLGLVIEKVPKQISEIRHLLKVIAIIAPLILIVSYSNLSTGIILIGIMMAMLFVASTKYSHFVAMGLGVIVFGIIGITAAQYRSGRIGAWISPETAGDDGYQTMQGLYAIGSGRLFGKGLGESVQKLGNVPESQNDMIFTIICEELGLFGAVCVILLYILLIWRMMIIANNARDLYGSMVVAGVMAHISLQVILNIAVVTNTIPNTGVTLPFISYGGTSMLFLMTEIGLVMGVSRGIKLETIE